MINGGGITRFKEHLACINGEVKGCEAVPEEVRDTFQKNLSAVKGKKMKRKKNVLDSLPSAERETRSDESEREIAATGLESLRTSNEVETTNIPHINGMQKKTVETQEFLVACSAVKLIKNDEGFTPPRATDPGWAHGVMVDGERHKVKCKYCQKVIVGGGISRLKEHLAGIRGNVAPCEEVPEAVHLQFKTLVGFKGFEKRRRHKGLDTGNNILPAPCLDNGGGDYDTGKTGKEKEVDTSIHLKKHKKNPYQMTIIQSDEPLNQSSFLKDIIDEADSAVSKFIYKAGIPLSVSNSCYFQKMAEAIAAAGPGYVMPSYDILGGKLLKRNVNEAKQKCSALKKCWEISGCSVLVERWTDKMSRTVINFFVYSSKGSVFLKSFDSIDDTHTFESLLGLFDSVVEEVGSSNIINFITDTKPSYKAAGQALATKYGTFFWTACSAHCIDLMLEKIADMDEVKGLLGKAKKITRFVYNNSSVVNLMRKRTGTRDIIQHGNNKNESIFLTLKSITSLREPLHQIFTNATEENSALSNQRAWVEVSEIMEDSHFWSLCDQTMRAIEPLLTVLSLLDCEDRPSSGYIYDGMEKAKRSIISAFSNQESDYLPYLNVVDNVWQEELYSPIHAAGYFLNPSIFYNSRFSNSKVIKKGLLDCIEVLEPDLCTQVKITSQLSFYEDAVGDFGRPVAVRGRESLAPGTWWSIYASDCPELQSLAIRILSQACSTCRSQTNWMMFERIHAKKRNRLEHQRLNDLMFVHHNLQLQERQESKKTWSTMDASNPLCVETLDPDLADWVEESIDGEDCSVMDSTILGEDSAVNCQLFGSDIFNVSVDDYSR